MALLALIVSAWYGSSMYCAVSSKSLLTGVALREGSHLRLSAVELTCLQMWLAAGLAFAASVALHGGRAGQFLKVLRSRDAVQRTVALAMVFSAGFVTLSLAYSIMSTALANTLRATEPINSILLARLFSGERVPAQLLLTVLPIVVGASLASAGNVDFSLLGLLYCVVSNNCFALRTIQYKAIRAKYGADHASLFALVCLFSGCLLLALLAWQDPARLVAQATLLTDARTATPELWSLVAVNGGSFFLYLQLSFATLSYVTVVTHAILNSFRRPAVILFDVARFGTVLSPLNWAGIALSCSGVALYSITKARLAAPKPAPESVPHTASASAKKQA